MAKPKVTATDQLSNVIEVVELGQRTGMLLVERGSGSVLEEGEIYFIGGQAVYASLAGLRGREALAALSRWGACRFAFDREAVRPEMNLTNPSQPALRPPAAPSVRPSWPDYSGSQPGYGGSWPTSGSGSWPTQQSVRPPVTHTNGSGVTGDHFGAQPPAAPRHLPAEGSWGQMGGYQPPQMQPAVGTAQAHDSLQRRPRRAPDVRDLMVVVSAHNLSRSHRTVLLLADGEHTVLDLARLSSKPVEEITGLLDDLENRGLVYYYEQLTG